MLRMLFRQIGPIIRCKDKWTPIWIKTGIPAAKVSRTWKDQGKVARVLIDTQISHGF